MVTGVSPGATGAIGVAVSCQFAGIAVPPLSLMTSFERSSVAVSLVAVHWTNVPRGTVTPPLRPSAKPGITVPALSISTQLQLTVDPGIGTADGSAFCA